MPSRTANLTAVCALGLRCGVAPTPSHGVRIIAARLFCMCALVEDVAGLGSTWYVVTHSHSRLHRRVCLLRTVLPDAVSNTCVHPAYGEGKTLLVSVAVR